MFSKAAIMFAIRSDLVDMFLSGEKTFEIRRVRPNCDIGTPIVFYSIRPISAISGGAIISGFKSMPPELLWPEVKNRVGITKEEFFTYLQGAREPCAIEVRDPWRATKLISLKELRLQFPRIRVPQSFCGLTTREYRAVLSMANSEWVNYSQHEDEAQNG